jgi:hypothetical protein
MLQSAVVRKTRAALIVCSVLFFNASFVVQGRAENKTSIDAFWTKFKAAVMKEDKQALAGMVKYPMGMPYGHSSIKTKTAFIKRYKQVFYEQANAKICFAQENPKKSESHANTYEVWCGEAVVYYFVWTKSGWKLEALDNINE